MATDVAPEARHQQRMFVRQSSGLVREVSVTNALFFNTAAFIGGGAGWYPVAYSLAFVPVGVAVFSTYAWAAIIVGAFAVVLGLIFASLASVMPRSGGDYVFTSRLIPRAGPFLGWIESFTLVFASLAIVAFEVPLVIRGIQVTGRIIGMGTGIDVFERANGWFAQDGVIKGIPGFVGALLVLAAILWLVVQPTRRFHRAVTTFAVVGLGSVVVMFIFGLLFVNPADFAQNLPRFADGATVGQLERAATDLGLNNGGNVGIFPLSLFAFMAAIVLLNYIGFQYSAYIAGEVQGNIKRGIMIAVLGALGIAVLMSSVYTDLLARRVGIMSQVGWGGLFWIGEPTPLGQPNLTHLTATVAEPGLWPIWALASIGGTLFPFLLCPVYINFLSRIMLAWSLDRRVPEWFGEVNERLRAPLNGILVCLGIAAVFAFLQNFAVLPASLAPPEGRLSLVTTLWFSILMALPTWVLPGVNALVGPFTRQDLLRNAPWRRWLPWMGAIWLAFSASLYWFAGIKPVLNFVGRGEGESTLDYYNRTGLSFTIGIVVLAVVIYVVQAARNRAGGVDQSMIYQAIPPE